MNIKKAPYTLLPYLGKTTATQYFGAVQDTPYSLLFHSGGAEGDSAQYDILLALPEKVVINQNGNNVMVVKDTQHSLVDKNPLDVIKEWIEEQSRSIEPHLFLDLTIPFKGGIAGALSYDFGRQLEKIPVLSNTDLALPDAVFGMYHCPLIVDHKAQTATLYCFSAANDEKTYHQLLDLYRGKPKSTNTLDDRSVPPFHLVTDWQSNMSEDDYHNKFCQVKRYIRSGDCYQINLAQRFKARYQGSPWEAYVHLTQLNTAPFSGYFNLDTAQLICLSPERFIQMKNASVKTEPIKGTRPRGIDNEQDQSLLLELKNSEKDRAENLMIVDLLRNDLGRTAIPGSVKVTELFGLYSFPSVHHMVSTIVSQTPAKTSPVDVIRQAFPGGSITGAPKIRAMQIIEELEPHRRNFYCGSLMYFSLDGQTDSNIMIRTLIATQQHIYTWAGGGLVDDSVAEQEYQETFDKLSKILDPLQSIK